MNQPVTWGAPRAERADAARDRLHLLTTARQVLAGQARPAMDGSAERAGPGKGTVFRRPGATEPRPGRPGHAVRAAGRGRLPSGGLRAGPAR